MLPSRVYTSNKQYVAGNQVVPYKYIYKLLSIKDGRLLVVAKSGPLGGIEGTARGFSG